VTDDIKPPLKAVRDGYAPAPFFFEQSNAEDGIRLVAWTGNLDQLRSLFRSIVESFSDNLELLFKTDTDSEDGQWTRFHGSVPSWKFKQAISTFDELIFRDGGSVLCVKDSRIGDYLALDQNGIFFLYSNKPIYPSIFQAHGFDMRQNELIDEKPHWNVRPKNASEDGKKFIQELGLLRV